MNTTRSLDKGEERGTAHQQSATQRSKLSLGPLLFILIFFLAVSAMMVSSPQAASAQGTVPPGTIPPGTIPPTAVIYLGFKSSDEIEFSNGTIPDFRYKNEDIVAYTPATQAFSLFFDGSACGLADANLDDFAIADDGTLLFTLRSKFTIPGLGKVDDSDVVSYTAGTEDCGAFGIRLRGADVGLTKGSEDIDALGLAADGNLLISTIGTAKVPSSSGELVIKDRDLIKLDEATGLWSLYFAGDDVGLTNSSEDIRSVWEDPTLDAQNNRQLYLTLSGNFTASSINQDEGDKNDIEGCTLLQSGEETQCSFFKLLDGETVGIENQLDGLAILGDPTTISSALTGLATGDTVEAAEATYDAADFAEAMAEGEEGVTTDDFIEVVTRIFVPFVQR